MRNRILAGVAGLALAAVIAGSAGAFRINETMPVATRADDFRLVDHTGFAQSLRRLVDVKAIVILSQVNGDEGSRKAAKALEALSANHKDVAFMMLNSSISDGRKEIVAEAKAQGYTIPVLDDDVQLAGEQLGVTYAGEAFVLQPKTLNVLYHGTVDGAGKALADIAAGKARSLLPRSRARARQSLFRSATARRSSARFPTPRTWLPSRGQVRRLPPGRRHRPVRDEGLCDGEGLLGNDPRSDPHRHDAPVAPRSDDRQVQA